MCIRDSLPPRRDDAPAAMPPPPAVPGSRELGPPRPPAPETAAPEAALASRLELIVHDEDPWQRDRVPQGALRPHRVVAIDDAAVPLECEPKSGRLRGPSSREDDDDDDDESAPTADNAGSPRSIPTHAPLPNIISSDDDRDELLRSPLLRRSSDDWIRGRESPHAFKFDDAADKLDEIFAPNALFIDRP